MAGALVNVIPKTEYNFDGIAGETTVMVPIGDPIYVVPYTNVVLIVRLHEVSLGSTNNLKFGLYPDGYLEGSGVSYRGTDTIGPAEVMEVSLFGKSAPSAIFRGARVSSAYVSLAIKVVCDTEGVPITATVSIDLCLKNPDHPSAIRIPPFASISADFADRYPQLQLLQQLFNPWGLDVGSVQFVVDALPHPLEAQAKSDRVIALSPQLVDRGSPRKVLGALAHELTHVAQIRRLGWPSAEARAIREEMIHGQAGMRQIPSALTEIFPGYLDPVDPQFTLEAIAARMEQIAKGIGLDSRLDQAGGCEGACATCSGKASCACGCSTAS